MHDKGDMSKIVLIRRHLINTLCLRKSFEKPPKKELDDDSRVVYIDTTDPEQFADQISAYTAEGYRVTATAHVFKRLQAVCVMEKDTNRKENEYAYRNDC